MTDATKVIQIISIVAIAVPILIGAAHFKQARTDVNIFLFFLLAGLSTDLSMFYFLHTGKTEYLPRIFNLYSFIESIVFFCIIYKNARTQLLRAITLIVIGIAALLWSSIVFIIPAFAILQHIPTHLFDFFYELTAAFLSAVALLQIIEKEDSALQLPDFWILLGVFFYCFCTFFIMSFLNTLLSQRIWVLNNIINIITYGFYSVGLLKFTKGK